MRPRLETPLYLAGFDCQLLPIEARGRSLPAHAATDRDTIVRISEPQAKLRFRPVFRQAGLQRDDVASPAETEHTLDPGAEHPARSPGVPGPATPAGVRRHRIDIGGNNIRLDAIVRGCLRPQCVVDRIEKIKQGNCAIAVPHLRRRKNAPHRSMTVLATVLSQAGGVAADIARIMGRAVERRREQLHQLCVMIDKIAAHRGHRPSRPRRVSRPAQNRPGLRDRIDATFLALCRSEPCAVVISGAAIPFSIPGDSFDSGSNALRMRTPSRRALRLAHVGERRKAVDRMDEVPAEPDAHALPAFTHTVHAVIPVPAADQRQAKRPCQFHRGIQRQGAVQVERSRVVAGLRLEERVMLARFEPPTFEERNRRFQDCHVARGLDIVRNRNGQPAAIVRNARPHPPAAFRQPPMLDIAFPELPAGSAQKVRAYKVRPRQQQCAAILQLVPKAIGTAGLIESGTPPHPAGKHLVQQPTIKHDVHRPVRRTHLHRAQRRSPVRRRAGQLGIKIGLAPLADEFPRRSPIRRLANGPDNLARGPRRQHNLGGKRRTRVEPGAARRLQRHVVEQRRRLSDAAATADERHPIAGPAGLAAIKVSKGNP